MFVFVSRLCSESMRSTGYPGAHALQLAWQYPQFYLLHARCSAYRTLASSTIYGDTERDPPGRRRSNSRSRRNRETSATDGILKSEIQCRYENTEKGCTNNNCPYKHSGRGRGRGAGVSFRSERERSHDRSKSGDRSSGDRSGDRQKSPGRTPARNSRRDRKRSRAD